MTTPTNEPQPLTELAQAVAQHRKSTCQTTAAELLKSIGEIRKLDQSSEKKQSSGCAQAVLSMLIALAAFGGAAFMNSGWPLLIALAAVVYAIVSVSKSLLSQKTNFENRRYELIAQLVGILSTDMSPAEPIQLAINLLPQDDKSKHSGKGEAGHWTVNHFHDPWLTLESRLLDGTKFSLHMAEKHQRRSRWKRGRSGKSKHKVKTKNSSEVSLFLKVKPEKYRQLEQLGASAHEAIKLPDWADIKSLEIDSQTLSLRVTTRRAWQVGTSETPTQADGTQLVGSMFLSLYQVLTLSREIGKAQR